MTRPILTYSLARAAATDAANAQMREDGRTRWSREDAILAHRTFLKLCPDAARLP